MEFGNAHSWYMAQRSLGWQRFFAWFPVDVDVGTTVWLQYVERKITGMSHSKRPSTAKYAYRKVGSTDESGWGGLF